MIPESLPVFADLGYAESFVTKTAAMFRLSTTIQHSPP